MTKVHCANVKITFQMFIISDFRQNSLPWLAWDRRSHLNQRKSPNHHLYKIDLGLDQRSETEFCPFWSILGLDNLSKLVNFWVSLNYRSTLDFIKYLSGWVGWCSGIFTCASRSWVQSPPDSISGHFFLLLLVCAPQFQKLGRNNVYTISTYL